VAATPRQSTPHEFNSGGEANTGTPHATPRKFTPREFNSGGEANTGTLRATPRKFTTPREFNSGGEANTGTPRKPTPNIATPHKANSDVSHVPPTNKRGRLDSVSQVGTTKKSRRSISHSTTDLSLPPNTPTVSAPTTDSEVEDLRGASRTTGGLFRGNAKGNTPNMADTCMYPIHPCHSLYLNCV
jgi:hypothetical protein